MATQLSPGVLVKETDASLVTSALSSVTGAIAGSFTSGPLGVPTLISNESQLVNIFGKPADDDYVTFFTAANFLQYSNRLVVTRAYNESSNNTMYVSDGTTPNNIQIVSETEWNNDFFLNSTYASIDFVAKAPSKKLNGIGVYVNSHYNRFKFTKANTESSTTLTANTHVNHKRVILNQDLTLMPGIDITSNTITSNNSYVMTLNYDSDNIIEFDIDGATYFSSNTTLLVSPDLSKLLPTLNNVPTTVKWKYADISKKPTTSDYAKNNDSTADEINIVIVDETGAVSGKKGTVLENYINLSKASDAKNEDGTTNYFVEVLKRDSKYIYPVTYKRSSNWYVPTAANTAFNIYNNTKSSAVANTGSWVRVTTADVVKAYDTFGDKERIDIDLIMTGDGESDTTVIRKALQLATDRKDCMTFTSPATLNDCLPSKTLTTTDILNNIVKYASNDYTQTEIDAGDVGLTVRDSFSVMDSGWKYQFDKYWNKYRWIPLNGDIAGLVAQTELQRDAWWSPAGFSRGQIKGAIKLSWNPDRAQRDELYKHNINPVVSFPNEGILLFGDKTLQEKSSAFDRINVRRLFIVLEKTIAKAAKYSLFEFNDAFTRSQFVALVEPYLREVKAKRGIYDFKIVCDESNNTTLVIDQNRFVGSIFVKPSRSINFIELNFVAVGTGVDFSTITANI